MDCVYVVYISESLKGNTYPPVGVYKNYEDAIKMRDQLNNENSITKIYDIVQCCVR